MVEALKFGLTVGEFWDMTPRETSAAIDAAAWRIRQGQMQSLSLAWHTAALTHAKKLPPLARLMGQLQAAQVRRNEPIEKRREEFEELKARMGRRGRGGDKERGRQGESVNHG